MFKRHVRELGEPAAYPAGQDQRDQQLWRSRHGQGHDRAVRYPTPDDPELWNAVRRYVDDPGSATRSGRYMELLGGELLDWDGPERAAFMRDIGHDARQVTDRELSSLLDSEWRSRLTAAW